MSAPHTTVLLIRHALTSAVGVRLTSRTPGVDLSTEGLAQVLRLRERLRAVPLAAVYSSPMERAIATAGPLARDRAIDVQVMEELNEVDFGDWTGLTFEELGGNPAWQRFNVERSAAAVPNGETAADVQRRIVGALAGLAERHRGQTIAVVSHADVIRNAVLHAASTPIDLWNRFEISPASITAVVYDGNRVPRLMTVNERPYRAPGA